MLKLYNAWCLDTADSATSNQNSKPPSIECRPSTNTQTHTAHITSWVFDFILRVSIQSGFFPFEKSEKDVLLSFFSMVLVKIKFCR